MMRRNKISMIVKALVSTAFAGVMGTFMACDDMNSIHQEYYDRGEMLYTGVVDSLKASVGYEKVQFTWEINADPRISKTVIYWNQRADSVVVDVNRTTDGRMPMSYLGEFDGGNYVFEFVTKDDAGNYSMPREIVVVALDEMYVNSLKARKIASSTLGEDGSLKIVWGEVGSSLLQYSTLEYELNGKKESVRVENTDKETTLPGLVLGSKYYVYSTYLPEDAFETFDSNLVEYEVK